MKTSKCYKNSSSRQMLCQPEGYNLQLFDRRYCFYRTDGLSLLRPKTKQHISKGTIGMFKHHPDYPVINVYKRLQKDIYWFINMLLKVIRL
jgi:hypothetical protein